MAKDNNLKDFLTDVADAIREKEGSTGLINPQDFSAKIRAIETGGGGESGGGGGASAGAVNFRDYDGTILHSYTKAQFLALAEMPTLPTQEGLTCQGWNYSLEDAKAYVEEYGKLDVGATYITDDGKTRLYITIAAEGRMDVPLRLLQSVSNGVVVDWGDGSTDTFTGTSATTLRHTYGKVGDYVITLEVLDGTLTLQGSSSYGIFADSMRVYGNMLQKVEIGTGMTSIGDFAFRNCYSLASVVIPNGVTSIGSSAFNGCYSLAILDFRTHTSVPTLSNTNAFTSVASDLKIVVPDGLYDTWIAATNWSTYASYIIKASVFNA